MFGVGKCQSVAGVDLVSAEVGLVVACIVAAVRRRPHRVAHPIGTVLPPTVPGARSAANPSPWQRCRAVIHHVCERSLHNQEYGDRLLVALLGCQSSLGDRIDQTVCGENTAEEIVLGRQRSDIGAEVGEQRVLL